MQTPFHRLARSPVGLKRWLLGCLVLGLIVPFSAFADDPDTASPVVSYVYLDTLAEAPPQPNVASPLVSYLYHDSLATAPDQPNVVSAVVSYLYYDWLGNDKLTFETSPTVSYFYQGGASGGAVAFQGRVVNALGQPLGQAVVEARVMESPAASVTTGVDGSYALPSLPAGTYALSAVKPGWLSDRRVVALSAVTMQQDMQLRLLPNPPSLAVAGSTPAFIPPPDGAQDSAVKVFDGTSFVANLALLDRNKMTVVMTHGWNSSPDAWPTSIAQTLRGAGGLWPGLANIVAWDWQTVAHAILPPEGSTPAQGVALGQALQQALGSDYRQKVHVIGHSLGALVNGYAVDYLHGHRRAGYGVASHPWLSANTHVTMFDDAAISRLISTDTALLLAGTATLLPSSTLLGWKNPVPHDFLWLDNYIASVGRYHPEAVNVVLQKGMQLALVEHSWFNAAVEAHSYPTTWYPRTVTSPSISFPGFGTSFEYNALHPGVAFPPNGPEFVPGIAFRQSQNAADEITLELVTDIEARLFYPAFSVVGAEAPGVVSGWVETGANWTAATGRKVGQVVVGVGQSVVVQVSAAVDRVVNGADRAWDGLVDMLNRPDIHIEMQTGLPGWMQGSRQAKDGGDETNTPAAIWLPVSVPPNVSLLAFDFALEGDGKEDALVFGINGTNLFTLAAKYIPSGVTNTSPILDVSAYAGTTNEFFFGILGGTSTNCAVRVERIRFLAFAPPALAITVATNGTTVLSWPSTASGLALESAASLDGGPWVDVANTPTLFGGRFEVTVPLTDQSRFFRLRAR